MFENRKPKGESQPVLRVCIGCGIEKNTTQDFYLSSEGYPSGRCKACCQIRQIEYRESRKSKYAEYANNWRKANLEKAKLAQSKYNKTEKAAAKRARYLERLKTRVVEPTMKCRDCGESKDSHTDFYRFEQPCKKCIRIKANQRRQTPEGKARRKVEYENNKEFAKKKTREWVLANPEKVKQYRKNAARKPHNVLKARQKNWRRREKIMCARVEGAEAITASWFETVKERQNHRCAYCSQSLPLTLDHVIPLARGGKHVRENILAACKPCNSRKSDFLLHEWNPPQILDGIVISIA